MGHERWFRGQHDGQSRPFDWLTAARQHGVPERLARALYERAVQQAHGSTQGSVRELYLALLAGARREASRPSPGKVTRTMRIQSGRAGRPRNAHVSPLTGQPIAPGKRTAISYIEPPRSLRKQEHSRAEAGPLAAMDEVFAGGPASELASADSRPSSDRWDMAAVNRNIEVSLGFLEVDHESEGEPAHDAMAGVMDDAVLEQPAAGAAELDSRELDAPQPLAAAVPEPFMSRMARAFGRRFDHVRIHRDSPVPAGRQAFSRGHDVHLGPDAPAPDSPEAERILAHELAHVAQRSMPATGWQSRSPSISALEVDAHQAALHALAGHAAGVRLAAPVGLALGYNDDPDTLDEETTRRARPGTGSGSAERGAPADRASGSRPAVPAVPAAGPEAAPRSEPTPAPAPAPTGTSAPAAPFMPAGAAPAAPAAPRTAAPAASSGGDEPLLAEAPDTLSADAQGRLAQIDADAQSATELVTELPTADEGTAAARGAVTEPQEEQDARAQAGVAQAIDDRPPPSPEIEAACERIREVIRSKRPPDEESLVDAQPREMAAEAGGEMNADIETRADSVRDGYADMETTPAGQPSREAVPVELPPEQVEVPDIDAAAGVPDELRADEVSLDADVEAQNQRFEDAGMTTEPAQLVEDGPIADARAGLSDLEAAAAADPQQVLADQEAAIAAAAGDMQALQEAAEQALSEARSGTVGTLGTMSGEITGSEEEQRAQAGARMQAIFERARTDVDALLSPLSEAALARWDAGVDQLATDFETSLASVQQRIEERYQSDGNWWDLSDEAAAGARWLGDQVLGLPDWVVEEYDSAEQTFADGCTSLITDISRDVNAVIEDCQAIIQQARDDIDAIVASLPEELQAWAQGEAARLGTELDALESQVTETRQTLNQDLIDRSNAAVQEVRERVHELREQARGVIGRIGDAIAAFLADPGRAIIDGLLHVLGIPPTNFWAMVDQLGDVIDGIADDPMGFANTMMAGVGQGFEQFFGNFPLHLGQSLFAWLFSKMGEAGVTMPRDFSIPSIVSLVLDVMGINWQRIRMLLARHIGEQNVAHIEQAYDIITTFIARGPLGLVELMREQLDPAMIVDMIRETAIRYLMENIVTRVAARIMMMLNPAGAILQAIEAIYRVLSWIYENAARIFTLIEAVVNGAAQILAGNTAGLAALVEHALVGLMVPVIDFLADYLGLGGIPAAIRDLVLGLQQRVERILDRVIGFVAERARALLGALGMGGDRAGADGGDQDDVLGEEIRFTADGEGHRLWVATQGSEAQLMVASEPKPVEVKLREWQPRVQNLSNDPDPERGNRIPRQRASELMSQAATMAGVADDLAEQLHDQWQRAGGGSDNQSDGEANGRPDDQALEAQQRSLTQILSELFELFGETNETLTHPVYALMGQQLVARGTPPAADGELKPAPEDYHYRSSESGYMWIQRNNGARDRQPGDGNGPAPAVHLDEQGVLREGAGSARDQDLGWLAREDVKQLLREKAAELASQTGWVAVFATAGIKLRAAPGADGEALTLAKIWAEDPAKEDNARATVQQAFERAMALTNEDNVANPRDDRPAWLDDPEERTQRAEQAATDLLNRIRDRELYFISPTDIPRSMDVAELVVPNPVHENDRSAITAALYPAIARGIEDTMPSTLDREIHHVLPLYLGGDHRIENLELVIGQAADPASVHYLMHQMINQTAVSFYLNDEIVASKLSYTELAQAIPRAVRKVILGTLYENGRIVYEEKTSPAVESAPGDA